MGSLLAEIKYFPIEDVLNTSCFYFDWGFNLVHSPKVPKEDRNKKIQPSSFQSSILCAKIKRPKPIEIT